MNFLFKSIYVYIDLQLYFPTNLLLFVEMLHFLLLRLKRVTNEFPVKYLDQMNPCGLIFNIVN